MTAKGKIAFQVVVCDRCGGQRVIGLACADCGQKPAAGEVNANVSRRRSALRRLQSELAAQVLSAPSGRIASPAEIQATLQQLLKSVMSFISQDGRGESVDGLAKAISSLHHLQVDSSAAEEFRPDRSRARATTKTLIELDGVWSQYCESFIAASPAESQKHGVWAQTRLDHAAAALGEFGTLAEAASELEDADRDYFDRAVAAIDRLHPNRPLLEVAAECSDEAKELCGVEVDSPHGIQFMLLSLVTSIHLDPQRFRVVLRETSMLCEGNPQLVALSNDPDAVAGLVEASRLLTATLHDHESLLKTGRPDPMLLRRLLKLHAEIYEDVTAPLIAWYLRLAGAKKMTYGKLRAAGAADLARSALASPDLVRWFEGIEPGLRNAPSHTHGFELKDDFVHFHLKSFDTVMPVAEVVDHVLANLESVAAALWSLSNALTNIGRSLPIDPDIEHYGFTPARIAAWWLSQSGAYVSRAALDGDTFVFSLQTPLANQLQMALALSNTLDSVQLTVDGSEAPVLRVPRAAWQQYAETIEGNTPAADSATALMRFLAECEIEDRPAITEDDLAWFAAVIGIDLLGGDTGSARRLREAIQLAKRTGATAVSASGTETLKVFRINDPLEVARWTQQLVENVRCLPKPGVPNGTNVLVE